MFSGIFNDLDVQLYVENKLFEIIHGKIKKSSSTWNFRCTICGDSKKNKSKMRGNYYPKNCSYYCFNCNQSASGLHVISKLGGIDIQTVRRDFLEFLRKDDKKIKPVTKPKEVIKEKPQKINIPDSWIQNKIVEQFIKDRRLDIAPFKPKSFSCYYDKNINRIVIPWFENGEIIYWQKRSITNKQIPKYLFPKQSEKPIFNLDNINESFPYIFCLEGSIDSMYVLNGVAIGGVTLTENQQETLSKYLCEPVIMLDNQHVDETAKRVTIKLAKENPNLKLFIWPKDIHEKDVNEYVINHGIDKFMDKNFLKSRIFSGLKGIVELKNL